MKVFVTRLLPDTIMGRLELSKEISELRVNREDRPLSRKELEDGIGWGDIILSQLVDNIDSSLITINPNLKLIANYAVGFNNIDIPSATVSPSDTGSALYLSIIAAMYQAELMSPAAGLRA